MFGMGGSEILVILIVALLFLGPDKLPDAAKQISKGIRDLKRHGRVLQETIENDENIGGALRDIKSALRGEDPPPAPRKVIQPPTPAPIVIGEAAAATVTAGTEAAPAAAEAAADPAHVDPAPTPDKPAVTLPATAGEPDPDVKTAPADELASMVRPVEGTVAKGSG